MLGIIVLAILAMMPLIFEMKRQGKLNIDKPEKRNHLFEDGQGNRDNPFRKQDEDQNQENWRYNP